MVAVLAGRIGPNGSGGQFKTRIDVDHAIAWHSLGARAGVLSGLNYSGVAGQMALDFAAGEALVSRRDASGNEQRLGYLLLNPTTSRVTFEPASPAARNDAVVAAVVDVTDGAVGTGALAPGGYLVAVPGVSGTTTPRLDSDITTYLGRGGWHRLLDVPIAAGATQINTATISTPWVQLRKRNPLGLTAATGWSFTSGYTGEWIPTRPGFIWVEVVATRTGADILSDAVGNISPDVTVTSTWPTALRPVGNHAYLNMDRADTTFGRARIGTSGILALVYGGAPSNEIVFTGQAVVFHGEYCLL